MKLSKTQSMVIDHMKNGWELGISHGMDSRAWLQEGGIGRGGKAITVSMATVWALRKLGLIDWEYVFPTSKVHFTDNGGAK
jgi:hypothetical protein